MILITRRSRWLRTIPCPQKLAAEAGFDAIWGSGFELSAAYTVPDASILSADTHLELMRAIGEVQDAPVIADLDTGYGNDAAAGMGEMVGGRSTSADPLPIVTIRHSTLPPICGRA